MQPDERECYSETFIIWNDEINLIGTLRPTTEGTAEICGSIKFRSGKHLSFFSPPDECRALRRRFLSICHCIAQFYNADVIGRKYLQTDPPRETSTFLPREHFSRN